MKPLISACVAKLPRLGSLRRALSDRRGVTALEYGLVAALAAVMIIGAMSNLSGGLSAVFTNTNAKLSGTAAKIE